MLPADIHQLWHKMFSNLKPCDIQVKICEVLFGFSEQDMHDVRVENFLDMVSSITESHERSLFH